MVATIPLTTTILMISISSALEILIGMLWYTALFGTQFLHLAYGRRRPHKLRLSNSDLTITVVLTLVRNTLLCLLYTVLGPRDPLHMYLLVLTLWVFVGSYNFVNRIYEGTSREVMSVHLGYWLVVLFVQAVVFGVTLLSFEPGSVADYNIGNLASVKVTKS